MRDILLAFDAGTFEFDLQLEGDTERDLRGDDGLLTAVIISLFTDRRALPDDALPDERIGLPSDRRGWWGDILPEPGDPLGSRLWLLWREKDMDVVVERARQYADEALQWIVRDGLVGERRVTASRVQGGYLGIGVELLPLPGTTDRAREWNFVYDYKNSVPLRMLAPGV
ncbi:MAG: phage GP46 family protein [Desulfovibrio sp.]|jgi:phage gp46-like protein|nr:phage GP46 family protein [Desulfovibrio sp.]